MTKWLILMAGGALGTVGRYVVSESVHRVFGKELPLGTLSVNFLGCLFIGFLGVLIEQKFHMNPETKLFFMMGILGAFTTFSTVMYESWKLVVSGSPMLASMNLLGTMVLGLAAFWLGAQAASAIV